MEDVLQEGFRKKISFLYGAKIAPQITERLLRILENFKERRSRHPHEIKQRIEGRVDTSQRDIALITYPDTIRDGTGQVGSLEALFGFIKRYKIYKLLKILHLLPFYSWDIDRGFSVKNYYQVDPRYGTWNDISRLGETTRLMFDFVVNHASIENPLVQGGLIEYALGREDPRYRNYAQYKDYVITFSDEEKPSKKSLKNLARPRHSPVLTRFSVLEEGRKLRAILGTPSGENKAKGVKVIDSGWVWTTFSRPKNHDGTEATCQVDLNFKNSNVFLEVIKILLFYIEKGSEFVRLDAIGYIWKTLGSACIHEKEVHIILQIIKDVLSAVAPGVSTIAEVNEPQNEVFKYLGANRNREADFVYQLAHFPLAVHAVLTGNGRYYMKWLETLSSAGGRQFVTVYGTHDGMGLKPIRGLLPPEEIDRMLRILIEEHGALPNYAVLPGDKKIVYEVCATPWHLINNPRSSERLDLQLRRYLAVLTLGLMIRGIPAIYINGLFGAPNNPAILDENRTINRQTFDQKWLYRQLDNPKSQMGRVLDGVSFILRKSSNEEAFNPNGPYARPVYLDSDLVVSAILEEADRKGMVLGMVNISDKEQELRINLSPKITDKKLLCDIILGENYTVDKAGMINISLESYQTIWLK